MGELESLDCLLNQMERQEYSPRIYWFVDLQLGPQLLVQIA